MWSRSYLLIVDEFVEWVRTRDYYQGQIRFHQTVPPCHAETQGCELPSAIGTRLADEGIDDLYAHQAKTIDAVRRDQNIVLATPTASGKTLTYAVPALERARKRDGRTLYIGPQVALIND